MIKPDSQAEYFCPRYSTSSRADCRLLHLPICYYLHIEPLTDPWKFASFDVYPEEVSSSEN